MSFLELDIKDLYVTENNDIPNEFYNVVLPEAVLYKRAAGFFSSSALISVSKGLRNFYYNGGTIRLIVSHLFSKEDIEAMEKGYKAREDIIYKSLVENFDINEISDNDGCNFLAWLIYEERLEIKVVTKKENKFGIFHDKFLILVDKDENKISARGSTNESKTAYEDNYESIEIDFSWDTSLNNRTKQREQQFDEIWEGKSIKWEINEFPKALKKQIIQIRKDIPPAPQKAFRNLHKKKTEGIAIPSNIELREYQKNAIKEWVKNNSTGIFEMATGTGKTITAISAIVKLLEQYEKHSQPCALVIVVPYKVLLEQWIDILAKFNISAIPCYDSKKTWFKKLKTTIELFNKGYNKHFCLITTNTTFSDDDFQSFLSKIQKDYIFCVDEMHHMATDKVIPLLPENARFRLGLSATLMTKFQSENMDELKKYFGGIVYEFSMKEAIGEFLTPYNYHPIFVELTDEELEQYHDISKKISKAIAMSGGFSDENIGLKALLSQRARLIASAENKLNALIELKDKIVNTNFNLFYCGDKLETTSNERFINRVNSVLKNDIGISIQKFTAEENKKQREDILKLFSNGLIQGLSAIRCLDEGVDIPQLRRAFILSSGTNPKEFIQRRGRVLRKAPGKEYAEIYDFIVFPVLSKEKLASLTPEEIQLEKTIINREFERLKEFADLAMNGIQSYNEFLKKWELYS
ncbi:MAG: DEAD/DEAH box helicase family protein [Candidatus Gastranaerophilales bacterium]|nr:DEAD/DEAH box helicase family protein [Candidatus Gastranaerophilales bacterium]